MLSRQGMPPQASYLFKHALVQDAAYGTLLREPRRALHARIAEALESQFAETAESQPEMLARHCTEAGLIEKAAGLWGKAGQRSLERSALVEAAAQLTRALDQIATLPGTPALRREQIKLQVALITPLVHVKGYAAPETKAAAERARLLIEQAEALGEPPEDPLLLFSVLYGFWVANYVAFNGDVVRELAAQFLALAEKQAATVPLMIGHRLMGHPFSIPGKSRKAARITIRRSRFTIPADIVRWPRDLAKTSGRRSCLIGRWRCGCLAILRRPRRDMPASAQECPRNRTRRDANVYHRPCARLTHFLLWKLRAANALADEFVALADEKGAPIWKAFGIDESRLLFALTGKAAEAVQKITSGLAAWRSTGVDIMDALALATPGAGPRGAWAIR